MALFMCHRGFDEKRYLNHMIRRVSNRGALIVATLSVKQDVVREGTYQETLDSFCRQAGSDLDNVVNGEFQKREVPG